MVFRRQPNGDYTTPDEQWLIRKSMRETSGHGAMWLIYDNSLLIDTVQGLEAAKHEAERKNMEQGNLR